MQCAAIRAQAGLDAGRGGRTEGPARRDATRYGAGELTGVAACGGY